MLTTVKKLDQMWLYVILALHFGFSYIKRFGQGLPLSLL